MELESSEESREMYFPDEQGEYALEEGVPHFAVQGLTDALTEVSQEVMEVQPPTEEYVMLFEVMMADHPEHQHPPVFSLNVGMIMHILKSDPMLRDLEHVQVDGPGIAYLFFYDKQG